MQLQHTMYAPRVGVQVTVNAATVARTCLNPGLGGAGRARRSQEEQGGARRSQGEPGRARKSQKRPGAARSRRGEEEPVAVLRTHTCCSADATHCNAWSSKTAEQTRASEAGFSQHTRVKLKDGGSICHPASMFPVSQSQIAAGQWLGALSASPTASSQLQWGNCEH